MKKGVAHQVSLDSTHRCVDLDSAICYIMYMCPEESSVNPIIDKRSDWNPYLAKSTVGHGQITPLTQNTPQQLLVQCSAMK